MTLDELRAEAEAFFEWPSDSKNHVTLASALIFAQLMRRKHNNVFIGGVEYIQKPKKLAKIENNIGATHYAILPDESIVFYKIKDIVFIWLSFSQVWKEITEEVPYSLIKIPSDSEFE